MQICVALVLKMDVHVDEPGQDRLAPGIEDASFLRYAEFAFSTHRDNPVAANQNDGLLDRRAGPVRGLWRRPSRLRCVAGKDAGPTGKE